MIGTHRRTGDGPHTSSRPRILATRKCFGFSCKNCRDGRHHAAVAPMRARP